MTPLANYAVWNLLLKKLSVTCNRESETPADLSLNVSSLNISPLCQTLSKALDISRNAPQV